MVAQSARLSAAVWAAAARRRGADGAANSPQTPVSAAQGRYSPALVHDCRWERVPNSNPRVGEERAGQLVIQQQVTMHPLRPSVAVFV